jgi:tRNA (guanine-N7-)-methyltransferase
MDPAHPPLRTFGRTRSRAIKPRQAALMTTLLPRVRVPDGPFDPQALAPEASDVWLEIGFGGGEHMAAQAARRRDVLVLGAEPFLNGVASALRHIEADGLTNVRLWPDDARDLMAALPEASLGRVFVLFPDPWPKARHVKRRLIQPAFVAEAARLMKPGARLRFATDWADYADQALLLMGRSPHFHWLAERAEDWRRAPADHIVTRYEEKRLGDCAPIWLEFERLGLSGGRSTGGGGSCSQG